MAIRRRSLCFLSVLMLAAAALSACSGGAEPFCGDDVTGAKLRLLPDGAEYALSDKDCRLLVERLGKAAYTKAPEDADAPTPDARVEFARSSSDAPYVLWICDGIAGALSVDGGAGGAAYWLNDESLNEAVLDIMEKYTQAAVSPP